MMGSVHAVFVKFNVGQRFLPLPQLNLDPKTSVIRAYLLYRLTMQTFWCPMLNATLICWAGLLGIR
jgi:hypothetical protein